MRCPYDQISGRAPALPTNGLSGGTLPSSRRRTIFPSIHRQILRPLRQLAITDPDVEIAAIEDEARAELIHIVDVRMDREQPLPLDAGARRRGAPLDHRRVAAVGGLGVRVVEKPVAREVQDGRPRRAARRPPRPTTGGTTLDRRDRARLEIDIAQAGRSDAPPPVRGHRGERRARPERAARARRPPPGSARPACRSSSSSPTVSVANTCAPRSVEHPAIAAMATIATAQARTTAATLCTGLSAGDERYARVRARPRQRVCAQPCVWCDEALASSRRAPHPPSYLAKARPLPVHQHPHAIDPRREPRREQAPASSPASVPAISTPTPGSASCGAA